MSPPAADPTPVFDTVRLRAVAESDDPLVQQWAAARTAADAASDDLADALEASANAGHAARDRLLDRIAREDRTELAPAIRALVKPEESCGVPVRTLIALRDSEAVELAAGWLARRRPEDAEDVGMVVHALATHGSDAALAAARKARDSRVFDRHAPLALAFTLLAETGTEDDATAAVTAWLQDPPSRWQGEEGVCAVLAECGLAAVPASWYAARRRAPDLLKILESTTNAPLDAVFSPNDRKEFARHWQKRHLQEVAARTQKATNEERLPSALCALVTAIRARSAALTRMDPDDAGDLLAILLGAALVSQLPALDVGAMDADALVAELSRDVRRIDPRTTRALMERAAELGDAVVPLLARLIAQQPATPGAGLAVAALLRCEGTERLRPLFLASQSPLPTTLVGSVLEVLQGAGADALPLLREALADAPATPTPGIVSLIQGAPFNETLDLVLPVLPRWLARSKQRTLAICAVLGSPRVIPILEADHVEGARGVGDVIRLVASLHGDAETAAKYPPAAPERASLLRGPDGRPLLPPMRLLLRCVDCDHGYYYEVRQVRISDPNARFVEEDGPPGPPEGIDVAEKIVCKRCGSEDRYRFTLEAVQSVRDAMQAEMMVAMEEQMRAQQAAAMRAASAPGAGPPEQPPPRLSSGGIILP